MGGENTLELSTFIAARQATGYGDICLFGLDSEREKASSCHPRSALRAAQRSNPLSCLLTNPLGESESGESEVVEHSCEPEDSDDSKDRESEDGTPDINRAGAVDVGDENAGSHAVEYDRSTLKNSKMTIMELQIQTEKGRPRMVAQLGNSI